MKLCRNDAARRTMNYVRMFAFLTLAVTLFVRSADAQAQAKDSQPQTYQTLYLASPAQQNDAVEIVTDLRNMLPRAKVYYVPSQSAISMIGTADDFLVAKKILSDIDRARKIYRLTYTITETDSGQSLGTHRVALIVASGETTDLKQGIKVPIVTGTNDPGTSTANSQVQYLDVGLNIKASLTGSSDDLRLHTKVEQSSLAEEKSSMGAQDPVIRQTTLEGMSTLTQGRPVVLGSLDIPGSTRHMEIEVSSEPVQ
ncbi:MAG: hypothetical protein WA826_09730 [Silvibacterium sp.]